jgi:hypothetical protein
MNAHDTAEIRQLREQVQNARKRSAYFYFVLIATIVCGIAASAIITVKLIERSERKLCAVVIEADDGYRRQPPGTDAGRVQAANYARLRGELGCPPFEESEK